MSYTPADKSILDKIQARLSNITTTNEYNNTIAKITRAQLTPYNGYDLPAVNIWATNTESAKDQYAQENRTLAVFIEGHTKTHDRPFTDVAMELAADIVQGVYRKTTAPKISDTKDFKLADTVQKMIFTGYDMFIGEGQDPFVGVLCRFEITYFAAIGDMTTYG